MLFQENIFKVKRNFGDFVTGFGQGRTNGMPAFFLFICNRTVGFLYMESVGMVEVNDILASFLEKVKMIVFFMTLFFQS